MPEAYDGRKQTNTESYGAEAGPSRARAALPIKSFCGDRDHGAEAGGIGADAMRERARWRAGWPRLEGGDMRRGRTSTIPDEGYADGGTPYTDEEMDIIDAEEAAGKGRMAPGAPLEDLPTPPLARDRAAETGEDVQDCFGGWHGGSHEGRPPGGRPKAGLDFERLVRRVVAEESEGARRERQIHELEQQYGTPAHESDNRRMPSVRDAYRSGDPTSRCDAQQAHGYSISV